MKGLCISAGVPHGHRPSRPMRSHEMVSADRRKEMYACGSIDGRDSHGFSTQPRSVHMILDLSIIASSRLFTIFQVGSPSGRLVQSVQPTAWRHVSPRLARFRFELRCVFPSTRHVQRSFMLWTVY